SRGGTADDVARGARARLESTHGRGAHRDHASAAITRRRDGTRGRLWNLIGLRVDAVICDVLDDDGLERTWTDVEDDVGALDARALQLAQQDLGEVETCGGGGDASLLARIDGLISDDVARFGSPPDIR